MLLLTAAAAAAAAAAAGLAEGGATLSFGPPVSIGPRWAENTGADMAWSPAPGVLATPLWLFSNSSCATTCAAATCSAPSCASCALSPCRPVSEIPLALSTDSGRSWRLSSARGLGYRRTGTDGHGHTASAAYGNASYEPQVDARWGSSAGLSAPAWGGLDLGLLVRDATSTSWSSAAGSRARYTYDTASGALTVTPTAETVTLDGLPKPAIASTFTPHGMRIRLDSAVALTLADGTRLLTALVSTTPWPAAHGHRPQCPWCLPRNPTDIALFRSTSNRTRFTFLSWVATAAATRALGVQEGPNEHAMVQLPGRQGRPGRLVVAFRQDAGDGWGGRYAPYMWTTSDDIGKTWATPVAMPSTGCARPRLLLVGDTLLMSGGRNDQPLAKPMRSRGVQVWSVSAETVATAPVGAVPDWTVHDVSYWHNRGRNASAGQLPFTHCVNSSVVRCVSVCAAGRPVADASPLPAV